MISRPVLRRIIYGENNFNRCYKLLTKLRKAIVYGRSVESTSATAKAAHTVHVMHLAHRVILENMTMKTYLTMRNLNTKPTPKSGLCWWIAGFHFLDDVPLRSQSAIRFGSKRTMEVPGR